MPKVTAFIANGSEEVECLAVIDVLKRAGIEVELVTINPTREVLTSHGINIIADKTLDEATYKDTDLFFLPGGVPGVPNLTADVRLAEILKTANEAGKKLAAICAAPSVLGLLGLLDGKNATCYPGWEDKLLGANITGAGVITDGNITTGRGLGFSIDMGLELVKILVDEATSNDIKVKIQHPDTI